MTKKAEISQISTERTYTLLQMALFQQLTLKPFEKITLTELCTCAMVPRSTFYRYFEDKYDLLRFCVQTFFTEAILTEEAIYFKDAYSIQNFLLVFIKMLNHYKEDYYKLYQTNKNGILMEVLKEYLSDILTARLKESEAQGQQLKIDPKVFTYLLTDFYFSAAKCFLDLSAAETFCSVESYVEDVCRFSDKDFFIP